jgi:hypothetical protein
VFAIRRRVLDRCPLCRSRGVSLWRTETFADGLHARVLLRCAECDTYRESVTSVWAADAYARRHARRRSQIALALRRAEREAMAADLELLVETLRRDLIGPDDFKAGAGRPARRPAFRSP